MNPSFSNCLKLSQSTKKTPKQETKTPFTQTQLIRSRTSTTISSSLMAYTTSPSSSSSSVVEAFSLNPVPYPVLVILGVISIFLGLQWYVSYEEVVEATEESMGWFLMAAPLVLLFAVRWLADWEGPTGLLLGTSAWDRRRRQYYLSGATEGGSPWGVLAAIVLLLVLVQYQSTFLESWFG